MNIIPRYYLPSRLLKITRWAKANPFKAQLLITLIQVILLVVGVYTGYNLYKAGIILPRSIVFIFGTIMLTGFLFVPFLPKRKTIVIPALVTRDRLVYFSMALSFYILMVAIGNKLSDNYPGSAVTQVLESVDQAIFPENITDEEYTYFETETTPALAAFASMTVTENLSTIDPVKDLKADKKAVKKAKKLERKKARMMKRVEKRMAAAGLASFGSVVLIILLSITLCAGICLIIGGFSGSAALIPLGAVVTAGSIWGIIKVVQQNKKDKVIK
jgi:hypothetical protein